MKKALTIAGSDTSSGAGIQADLRIFSMLKVYGTSAITAVTAQNTKSIFMIRTVDSKMVMAQIRSVLKDIDIHAIKIGMVYSKEIINSIVRELKNVNIPLILDPIFRAGTGKALLKNDAYATFIKKLVPIVDVVTPNHMEAERISNVKIYDEDDAKIAAERIS